MAAQGTAAGSHFSLTARATLLPPEILSVIFLKLSTKKERLAFLGVCKSWRNGCSLGLSELILPWPVSSGVERMAALSNPGAHGKQQIEVSPEHARSRRPISSRLLTRPGSRSSTILSVKWLGAALRLFCQLRVLRITVPVLPDALRVISHSPQLHSVSILLRPPPFSSDADVWRLEAPSLSGLSFGQMRDEAYESAFTSFVTSCTALEELSLEMRACRWEALPLLSASQLSRLASSLTSLRNLSIKSPLFATHALEPLLSLNHLASLTFPLDLPREHLVSTPSDSSSWIARLTHLHLRPYSQLLPERVHTAARLSITLPPAVSSLTSLLSLSVKGYGGSSLHRAEFTSSPLTTIPDLSALRQLTHLNLSFLRELHQLPDELCLLPGLALLQIHDCPRLSTLPGHIGLLSNSLTEVSLHALGLLALPDSFVSLSGLNSLSLSHCFSLDGLPEGFGLLSSLHSLSISYCKLIPQLPTTCSLLTSLASLSLTFNTFAVSPSLCASLSRLESLRLTISKPADLHIAPALRSLSSLSDLTLTLTDDTSAMSIRGDQIAAALPCLPCMAALKVEDLRSSCYAGYFPPAEEDAGADEGEGEGGEGTALEQEAVPAEGSREGARTAVVEDDAGAANGVVPGGGAVRFSRRVFFHPSYPALSGLRELRLKCLWLNFSHLSFPRLQLLDLVLLTHSPSAASSALPLPRPFSHSSPPAALPSPGTPARCLRSLLLEAFQCERLQSFVLFVPGVPNVLSAPRGQACHTAMRSLLVFPGTTFPQPPPLLHTFLLNNIDLLPWL